MIINKTINTIRGLALDEIAEANSGHPGIALGAAPIVFSVYKNMVYNPSDNKAPLRDRFVLSAGHGSSMLYAVLSLLTNKINYNELKAFRKLGSIFSGHPELDLPFIDAATGPLGQGVAMAVGMALAEKKAYFNAGIDKGNYTYCLAGDGCLMEGVAIEALDLAITLNLNKFILLYDNNNITIEGAATLAQQIDPAKVFSAKGFNVIVVKDGNNEKLISKAILKAKKSDKPSVIICNTIIGYGSNKVGLCGVHGTPFSKSEVIEIKKNLGLSTQEFFVDSDVLEYCNELKAFKQAEYNRREESNLKIEDLNLKREAITKLNLDLNKEMSTRDAGGITLNAIADRWQNYFLGGNADVAPSTRQYIATEKFISANDFSGSNIHFGIREHAMAAICNGINLYGVNRAFASTFFSFFDYMKPAVRMSALMKQNIIYLFTSDSIGAGEDGPTHQPIEHLATIRAIPNLCDFRPSDPIETMYCYLEALKLKVPSAIILTRQKVKPLNLSSAKLVSKGAYVAFEPKSEIKGVIITSGSEVALSISAASLMDEKGFGVRVVNIVSSYLFDKLSESEREKILPQKLTNRIIVEAASELSLSKYVGINAKNVCVNEFGKSGKGEDLFKLFGFTEQNIASKFGVKL